MAIADGEDILASDFVGTSAGSGDAGKVPKLNSDGLLDRSFIPNAFGGDGSDGAAGVSSSSVSLDLGGARVYVKNYASVSITGTGALTFTNPHANGTLIIFNVTGDVTITSSAARAIDLRGIGGAGSTGNGNDGSGYKCAYPTGGGTTSGYSGSAPTAQDISGMLGAAQKYGQGARITPNAPLDAFFCGAGGGGGAGLSSATGGRGGGGLLIRCGGNLNITGVIDASGSAGGNSSGSSGGGTQNSGGRGGGGLTASNLPGFGSSASGVTSAAGGGGGGSIVILYAGTLTANTATLTVTGGAAGTTGNGQAASAGADGFSLVAPNTELV